MTAISCNPFPDDRKFVVWFQNVLFRYVGFCEGWYFESYCFVTDWVIKLLLYTEAGTRTNWSISRQMLMAGEVLTLMSCNLLSDTRMSRLCFQVVRFRDKSRTSFWSVTTRCLFMACKFPLGRFTMHSHRKRINSLGQDWRKWLLHLRESNWNNWRAETFCVFIVQRS